MPPVMFTYAYLQMVQFQLMEMAGVEREQCRPALMCVCSERQWLLWRYHIGLHVLENKHCNNDYKLCIQDCHHPTAVKYGVTFTKKFFFKIISRGNYLILIIYLNKFKFWQSCLLVNSSYNLELWTRMVEVLLNYIRAAALFLSP